MVKADGQNHPMALHGVGMGVFALNIFNPVLRCFIRCFLSYGSQSIPSPFHLSWLCLVEYLDFFTDEEVSYKNWYLLIVYNIFKL